MLAKLQEVVICTLISSLGEHLIRIHFGTNLACERQTFLLAHRRWGTFRETSLSGDERGETSAVRRLGQIHRANRHIIDNCFSQYNFKFCLFNMCSPFPDQDIAITSLNIGRVCNINLWKFEPVYRIVSETEILFKNGSQLYPCFLSLSSFAAFIGRYFLRSCLNGPENCKNWSGWLLDSSTFELVNLYSIRTPLWVNSCANETKCKEI